MKSTTRRVVLGAGLLSLSAAMATSAFAAPRDRDRQDVRDARREVREEMRDVRNADTPAERRREEAELRDAQRDLRREQAEARNRDGRRGDRDRDGRWDRDRDGRRDRDRDGRWDHHRRPDWNNNRRPGWNNRPDWNNGRPIPRPIPRPGYNGGYNNGYGYGGGYNNGYGSGYNQSDFRQFTGRVEQVSNGGQFRVRAENGQYFNVRSNVYVREGQRVRVEGYLYNGAIVNSRVNLY